MSKLFYHYKGCYWQHWVFLLPANGHGSVVGNIAGAGNLYPVKAGSIESRDRIQQATIQIICRDRE